jgi:hypothetical protein
MKNMSETCVKINREINMVNFEYSDLPIFSKGHKLKIRDCIPKWIVFNNKVGDSDPFQLLKVAITQLTQLLVYRSCVGHIRLKTVGCQEH